MSYSVIWNNEKGEQPEWRTWPLTGITESYRLQHKFSPTLTVDVTGGTIEPIDGKYGVFIYGSDDGVISSAMQISGAVLESATDKMRVYSKGVAMDTTVNTNAMYVYPGGYASGVIFSKHTFGVHSGGSADNVVLSDGSALISGAVTSLTKSTDGFIYIEGGTVSSLDYHGIRSDVVVRNGGLLMDVNQVERGAIVLSGGTASGYNLNSGSLYVLSAGFATDVTASCGIVYVRDGGVLQDCEGITSNAFINISSGAVASSVRSVSGAVVYVSAGGLLVSAHQEGGYLHVFSGVVSHAIGGPRISDGGYVNDLTVASKNTARVYTGGLFETATVLSGGVLQISGGTGAGIVVLNGGTIVAFSGASAIDVTSADGAKVDSKAGAYITYKQ